MAAELKEAFNDADVELIPSRGGRFEVVADGIPIFEKSKVGRHPVPGEVLERMRKKI